MVCVNPKLRLDDSNGKYRIFLKNDNESKERDASHQERDASISGQISGQEDLSNSPDIKFNSSLSSIDQNPEKNSRDIVKEDSDHDVENSETMRKIHFEDENSVIHNASVCYKYSER